MMSLPIRKSRIKAILTEPTSPAKHFAFLRKLEETEDNNRTNHGIDEVRFYKSYHLLIDVCQCRKYNQRVTSRYPINPIHKVVGIDDARTDYQGYDYPPPGQREQPPLIKHHSHSREMKKQSCHLSGGFYIVHEADERHQCQGKQEPGIFKATRQEIANAPK